MSRSRGFAPETLRTLSVALISMAAISRHPTLAATAAGAGLVFFVWSLTVDGSARDPHVFRWAALAVILLLLLRFSGSFIVPGATSRLVWLGLLIAAAVLAVVFGHRRWFRRVSIAAGLLAVVFVTMSLSIGEWRGDLGYDVYWMHRETGEALLEGQNPYTDAVQVRNGSPFAPEGAVIEGYPYPPVVAGTYGVAATGLDPRLVSAVSWLGVLGWLAWLARREGREGDTAYAMFLLCAGLAAWPVVWFASWTEPLSVGLFLLCALLWRRRPVLSAVALGLALASKQYFIFLAPLVLLHRDELKRMRLGVSLSVAAGTILVGLIPDPDAFVSATLGNLSEIGFRPDTQSLSGLLAAEGIDFFLSSGAWIVVGLFLAAIVAIRSASVSDLIGRAGLVMGLVFFLGQAFMNYWFLVLALIAAAAVLAARSERSQHFDESESVHVPRMGRTVPILREREP